MCGIVGCILKENKNVAPILFDCISKIEARGYDSVGLATFDKDIIFVKKSKGKIDYVDKYLNLSDMPGKYGVAHVRWASVGYPSNENAHPHFDETHSIAVVHNGIIDNYAEIKDMLLKEGYSFKSTTDSEVIPHLIKKYMDEGLDLKCALRKTINHIEGIYAFATISKNEPGKIFATRNHSPLNLGLCENGFYVTDEISVIKEYCNNIIYLEDGDIACLDEDNVSIYDKNDNIIKREIKEIKWDEIITPPSYEHFMLKEINEQAISVKNMLKQEETIKNMLKDIGEFERICFVSSGSSYNASLTGKYLFETLAGIPTDVINVYDSRYASKTWDKNTLVIFISITGENYDQILALRQAKKTSKTLVMVCYPNSSMQKEAEYFIPILSGPELGHSTKTYISQLTIIYLIVGIISKNYKLIKQLYDVPEYIDEVLLKSNEIEEITRKYEFINNAIYIGYGLGYSIALEGAFKLKEISRIFTESCNGWELQPKTTRLIDDNIPVIAIIPPGNNIDRIMTKLSQIKKLGANIILIGHDDKLNKISDSMIKINSKVNNLIAPLVYIVPLQLISYYVALKKGYSPDKPFN